MFIKEREQEKKRECKEGQICVEKRTRQNWYVYKREQVRKDMFMRENMEWRICL